MLRRLAPFLLVLACFILDTTVLPVAYGGIYTVPLTAVAVLCIGMVLGRMRGLLYGTLGGLLMDITTGTLGMMTYFFMFIGFMIGLIVYVPSERILPSRRKQQRRLFWRAAWVFALYALGEVALLTIQYFNTATFQWIYLLNIIIRAAVCTVLCTLLRPVFAWMLVGKTPAKSGKKSREREVKRF